MSDYDERKGIQLGKSKPRLIIGIIFLLALFAQQGSNNKALVLYDFMLIAAFVLWVIIELLIGIVKVFKKY